MTGVILEKTGVWQMKRAIRHYKRLLTKTFAGAELLVSIQAGQDAMGAFVGESKFHLAPPLGLRLDFTGPDSIDFMAFTWDDYLTDLGGWKPSLGYDLVPESEVGSAEWLYGQLPPSELYGTDAEADERAYFLALDAWLGRKKIRAVIEAD